LQVIHIRLPNTVRFQYLLLLLVSLLLADGLVTQLITEAGLGREVNPFLQNLGNGWNFIAFKTAGALISAFILWDIHRRHTKLAIIVTVLFIIAYTGIVYWNIFSFFVACL
jgi:hypothetical protein